MVYTDLLPESGGQHVGSWSARRGRRVGMRKAGLTCDWGLAARASRVPASALPFASASAILPA